MEKKTYNEKLTDKKDLPKVVDLSDRPDLVARYGGSKLLFASPLQYNEIMANVPKGKIVTADKIREHLANKVGADLACPVSAGIFINICAKASEERNDNKIPFWRTLKSKGELNEKFPNGIEGQKMHLEIEGHEIVKRGKKYFVKDYEKNLWIVE